MLASEKDLRLARLFVAVVLGDADEMRRLRARAPAGEPDRAWREALLQAHVFAGFPRAVEAYDVLERAGGLGDTGPEEALREPDRRERGAALFDLVYGRHAQAVRGALERAHPDFAAFIEGHAYGRILSRPGLVPAQRELLAVAALAALGQERQLASHVRGYLRCGGDARSLEPALDALADLVRAERLERARRVVERFAAGASSDEASERGAGG